MADSASHAPISLALRSRIDRVGSAPIRSLQSNPLASSILLRSHPSAEQRGTKAAASSIASRSKSAIHHRPSSFDAAEEARESSHGFAFAEETPARAIHCPPARTEKTSRRTLKHWMYCASLMCS